jgi:hypothetical protein
MGLPLGQFTQRAASPLHDFGSDGHLLIGRNAVTSRRLREIQGVAGRNTQAGARRLRENDAERLAEPGDLQDNHRTPILVTPAMLLSEPQTLAIINATRPLQEHERAALLTELITQLAGRHEIGDGELGRMLARLQRDHFRSRPSDAEVGAREAQYRYMDGAAQARIGTDFFREMRQRHAVG